MTQEKCPSCESLLDVGIGREYEDETPIYVVNSVYGCDSGCEYVRVYVNCPHCGYEDDDGEFGYYEDDEEALDAVQSVLRYIEKINRK